jgi:hypothetical protein
MPRLGKGNSKTYCKIGVLWILLTVVFETALGYVMGNSFFDILRAYDIRTGNLWLIIVIFTGLMPYLVAKTKKIF